MMRYRWPEMRLPAVLALCALAAAVYADAEQPRQRPSREAMIVPDAAEFSTLLQQVPKELDECELVGTPTTYRASDLLSHLGDRARDILDYGHEWTVSAQYRVGTNGLLLTADVHRMKDALEAYGPFSRRRPHPAETPVGLRMPSFWTGAHLHLWRGPFYLHVYPETEDALWRGAVQEIAQATVDSLTGRAGMPDMLRLLPGRRRGGVSPRYYHGQVPDLPVHGQALVATYTEKTTTTCEFVLLRENDFEAASTAYDSLVSSLLTGQEAPEPLTEIADRAELFVSTQWGNCGIMQQDHYVAAVLGFTDRQLAEALLRMTATNVRVHLLMRPEADGDQAGPR